MTAEHARIPVTVLTGFLGSGKTTLLNALLQRPELSDTAVIVNELGDIGIDHLLVSNAIDNVLLLDSGCLCCTVLGSLKETLADLYHRRARNELPAFARVLVETTGLADPAPIVQSLLKDGLITPYFHLAGVVATLDALFAEAQAVDHPEIIKQIAIADRLVVTKTDLTEGQCPPGLRDLVHSLNPLAPLHVARSPQFDPHELLSNDAFERGSTAGWLATAGCSTSPRVATPVHHSGVQAHSFTINQPVGWAGLAAWTDLVREFFGAHMLRCKGLLYITEIRAPVVIHGVQTVFAAPQRLERWPSDDHRSRIVCITRSLDPNLLKASLAVLSAEPGTYRPASIQELLSPQAPQEPWPINRE